MITRKSLLLISFLSLSLFLSSCLDDAGNTQQEQLQQDIVAIDTYLSSKGITPLKDPSGLRIVIDSLGNGLPSSYTTTVKVDYKGYLLSNLSKFEEGTISGVPTGFIAGWQIALTTLPEGTKATIYIPSGYAYGTASQPKIPANSVLIFQIKIVDVVRPAAYYTKIASDSVAIDAFIATNSIANVVKDSTGIRYVITNPGSGPTATWFNRLTLTKYKASLLDGTLIYEAPATITPDGTFYSRPVDYLIDGLKIGLQKMRAGSKYTFYVPSGYAYGTTGLSPTVPANANMIFEIEVQSIAAP